MTAKMGMREALEKSEINERIVIGAREIELGLKPPRSHLLFSIAAI
jgi:hypothetical protein